MPGAATRRFGVLQALPEAARWPTVETARVPQETRAKESESSMSKPDWFKVPNVSIGGGPKIDWTFTGDVGRAECCGAKAYTERRDEETADLRITAESGDVIADLVVRKMTLDESITVSVMNVGCALLWSHARWVEAQAKEGAA